MSPVDVDDNGIDEIIQSQEGQIDVVEQNLNTFHKSFRMTEFENFYPSALKSGTLDSVAFYIFSKTADSNMVDLLCHSKNNGLEKRIIRPLYRFPRPHRQNSSHFVQTISHLFDWRHSDSKTSYFKLSTPRSKNFERGIIATDSELLNEKWRFTCGPQVRNPVLADINSDSLNEIIMGSYASSNGLYHNGTGDDSSYVFVLNHDGSLRWRKTMGGYFTGVFTYPGRFRTTGMDIVAITQNSSSNKSILEGVFILDGKSGKVIEGPRYFGRKIPKNHSPNFNRVADFDRDGMDDIVIGNTDGFVRLLDKNLNLISISDNYRKEIQVWAICDMNGDGYLEVVCKLPHEKVVILSHMLEEMASFPLEVESPHIIYPVKYGATTRLLLYSPFPHGNDKTNIWRMLELQESLVPFETYSGLAKYFWWGLGGVSFMGVLLISFSARKRTFQHMFVQLLTQAKLFDNALLLRENGLIKAAGRHWLDLADTNAEMVSGHNITSIAGLPDSLRSNIKKGLAEKSISQYNIIIEKNGHKTPLLIQMNYVKIIALYRATLRFISEENFRANIKHWSNAAQKLAHGIKNPLTSMKLNLDELKSHVQETTDDDEAKMHIDSISLQIEKLRRMADGFTRFIEFEEPALSAMDVNEFLKKQVAQLSDDIPAKIRVKLDLNRALPPALFNSEQLSFAFENVLFNAVQSFDDHGTIFIQTEFIQHIQNTTDAAQDYVEIRIQDNGCGIDADILNRVTDPYFTTKKEGTGLGLNLVVKIMEMLNGQFDIQSQKDEGTIVILRLKSAA